MKGLPRSLSRAPFNQPKEYVQKVRYPVNHQVTVAAAGAGVGFGSVVIGDFPEGNIQLLGRAAALSFSTASANITNATYTPTFSIGTTADVDGNFNSPTTDNDIMALRTSTIAAGKVSPMTAHFVASDVVPAALNNRDGSLEVNLNLQVPAADITDASSAVFTVTGYVEITYAVLGDL